MMHAELIDDEDFCGYLRQLGIDVPDEADPETACTCALQALNPQRVKDLLYLIDELINGQFTLLPSVHQAIFYQLLPALQMKNRPF